MNLQRSRDTVNTQIPQSGFPSNRKKECADNFPYLHQITGGSPTQFIDKKSVALEI